MTPENQKMKQFLTENGINATPKFLWKGSLKRCWRIHSYKMIKGSLIEGEKWHNNFDLQNKLTSLGFLDFDGKPLSNYSGNGGMFHIFARNEKLTQEFVFLNKGTE